MMCTHLRAERASGPRPLFPPRGPCAVLIALAIIAMAPARSATAPLEVRVDGGVIRGALERNVIAYKGIPYAAPPVGVLRWAPPRPVKPWKGVRRARRFGPDCAQLPTPGDDAPLRTLPKESCLYINLWRPRGPARHLPVMVWIYGGGFVDGGTSPAAYDGTQFARDGVVLVSFNYRLGNFGFFAFPALSRAQSGKLLGNYAFMDQIAALEWVRHNVAAFGGDPHNVTVFGESAGGMSVHALLMTPLAQGLFQRAIIESGAGRDNILRARPLTGAADSAEAVGVRLARHLGIAREVHAYWVAFAKTGRPDPAGLPAWPEYDSRRDRLMSFTERGPVAEPDPWRSRLDLAARVAKREAH